MADCTASQVFQTHTQTHAKADRVRPQTNCTNCARCVSSKRSSITANTPKANAERTLPEWQYLARTAERAGLQLNSLRTVRPCQIKPKLAKTQPRATNTNRLSSAISIWGRPQTIVLNSSQANSDKNAAGRTETTPRLTKHNGVLNSNPTECTNRIAALCRLNSFLRNSEASEMYESYSPRNWHKSQRQTTYAIFERDWNVFSAIN